jgi:hypothetical protein
MARAACPGRTAAGMTMVIQPNVITQDERAGVQTGELVLVSRTGWESLRRFPRGFARLWAGPEPYRRAGAAPACSRC